MLFGTYDPTKVTMQLGSITVIGFVDGTFVKVYRNEELWSLKVSADGHGARTRNANRSGRAEFTLKQTSPSNDQLQAQAIVDELSGGGVASLFIKDSSSLAARAQGANAWIIKIPDFERAKEEGEVTWVIETDFLDLVQSGASPIPGTV